MGYPLYKGLKKPLIFLGLKDKYIFYGIGSMVGAFILAALFSNIIGILGSVVGLGLGALGVYLVYRIQDKKGLYNKTKNTNEVHIIPNRINRRINKKNEKQAGSLRNAIYRL